jgi:hypothetical protein
MTPTASSTLLREVIDIPERAGADDYVLKLTEGVGEGRLAATVDDYVVTEDLANSFDAALDLVTDALKNQTSRAAFLAGSFGSGKSHFMAVLYALLSHEDRLADARRAVRAKPELAPILTRYDDALHGKKLLRLAFHFLEAETVEQCVLGGYVAQIKTLHPDAPLPAVHHSDKLLDDAERLREQMGEDAFLAGLNRNTTGSGAGGGGGGDVWGGVLEDDQPWTSASYDAARSAEPSDPQRQRLVSALVQAYFTAFTSGGTFVSLDEGLSVISTHAKSLGYDGVVMFLDELVLWLAFQVRNQEFFGREAQKVTKFVESGMGSRAIPIITFVARQLDLSKYFVEHVGGAGGQQQALDNAFRHQQGRFRTIELGDDNLPYVAEKRLLKPRDAAAKAILDEEFAKLDRRPEVWDALLDGVNTDDQHRGADQAAFRRTYPFSPALVSTLRTLASAMQRDRTALKVMQQLLVDHREHLTVSEVIPVGDVFDLVVQGNQAISPDMAGRFRNAQTLYHEKLRPLLLRDHKLNASDVAELPPHHPFRADDRLVKTLVLSAVAPEVPALKELTASRLAALNHGSIVSPLPGQEASVVLTKLKRWHAEVPEIHIAADSRNPVIRLKISEVDYESVVEKAKGEDNEGRRRATLKALVWEALKLSEIEGDLAGVSRQTRIWRGSRREVDVIFGNVRDRTWLTDDHFQANGDTWRFVIDYPFDSEGRAARDDVIRVEELQSSGKVTNTLAWIPHFLSEERQRDLGRLCILDWLLGGTGDRWRDMASDLAPADRVQARTILENQRDALRERLRHATQEAYGAARPTPGTLALEDAHDKVLVSLNPEFNPQAPVGADLAAAFANLVDQALQTSFPGHPRFEPEDTEVRPKEINAVLDAVNAARQDPDGRVFIEPARRDDVRRVANQLGVGHMGETHYLFTGGQFRWQSEISKAMGAAELGTSDPVTVGQLRSWIRNVKPRQGLRQELEDLVISAWAVLEGRSWYRFGGPLTPTPKPGSLTDDIELRPVALPSRDDWTVAVRRAAAILGVHANAFLTGASVAELAADVRSAVGPHVAAARTVVQLLENVHNRLGVAVEGPGVHRLATARAANALVVDLAQRNNAVSLVERLARADIPTTEQAVGVSLNSAFNLNAQLQSYSWDRLTPLVKAERHRDNRGKAAKEILDRLRAALLADELSQRLEDALRRADDEAFKWALWQPEPIDDEDEEEDETRASGRAAVRHRADLDGVQKQLADFVDQHQGHEIEVEWRVNP